MPTETEVKIKINTFDEIKNKLLNLNAELYKKRALETDEYFDKKAILKKTGKVLRLRDNSILTYKGAEQNKQTNKKHKKKMKETMKVREEIEVMVDNAENLKKILEKIGFSIVARKEKYREAYVLNLTKICIDETPIGNYIEIEGTKEGVKQIASALGFSEKQFIKKSYSTLWEEYAGQHKIKGDMLFSGGVK